MAEVNAPSYLQGGSHPAQSDRLVLGGLYGASTTGGVLEGLAVTAGGVGLSVDVQPGIAIVENPAPWGGPYNVGSDSVVNVPLVPANASNPRIDVIVARVYDSAYEGAEDRWALEVVTGAAAASPLPPTLPNRSLALAQVTVPASASSIGAGDVTDLRAAVGAAGGGLGQFVRLDGGTMSGNLDMGGNRITTLGDPTTDLQAVNKRYADAAFRLVSEVKLTTSNELYVTAPVPSNALALRVDLHGSLDGPGGHVRMMFNGGISAGDYRSWRLSWADVGANNTADHTNRDDCFSVLSDPDTRIAIAIVAHVNMTVSSTYVNGLAHAHESSHLNMVASQWGGIYQAAGYGGITSVRFRSPGSEGDGYWQPGARVRVFAALGTPV